MNQKHLVYIVFILLFCMNAMGQQNVTIKPSDDVFAVLESVVDFESTITFEAGYYRLAPPADTDSKHSLLTPPAGTRISGAGSGMDPAKATILDCQMLFEHGIEIGDLFDSVVIENLTILNTYDDLITLGEDVLDIQFHNIWALKTHGDCVEIDGGNAQFDFCVFGWSGADTLHNDNDTLANVVYTNCDVFLGESDLADADHGQMIFRNCIFYAGNGTNDLMNDNDDDGRIIVRASAGWDPFDGDPPGITEEMFGRLELETDTDILPDVDETNVGEDPLYVKPPSLAAPGVAYLAKDIDLRLLPGSPAFTVGSTAFDADHNPTGDPTYAGSQGPAPEDAGIEGWYLH